MTVFLNSWAIHKHPNISTLRNLRFLTDRYAILFGAYCCHFYKQLSNCDNMVEGPFYDVHLECFNKWVGSTLTNQLLLHDVFIIPLGLSAFTATALFADFYLWDMDTAIVFMDSFIIPGNEAATFYLMSYTRVPTLHYSSALQIGGIIMMDIMFYRTHV